MTGVAALPMYDLPQIRAPLRDLWSAIASRLDAAPDELTWQGDPADAWGDPRLVLGQTCGWPLITELRDTVTVVGAFGYDIGANDDRTADRDGWAGLPTYRSVLVAAAMRPLDSFAGSVAAVNAHDSLSGWVSLGVAVADCGGPSPFFARLAETGSHRASVAAVRSGEAAVASIDAVSWALFERHLPTLTRGLAVVGRGPTVPTLPLITSAGDPEPVRAAVEAAVADPATAACRAALLISRFSPVDLAAYDRLADLGSTAFDVLGAAPPHSPS